MDMDERRRNKVEEALKASETGKVQKEANKY